eukprot:3336961-Amphidinium_carterae.1
MVLPFSVSNSEFICSFVSELPKIGVARVGSFRGEETILEEQKLAAQDKAKNNLEEAMQNNNLQAAMPLHVMRKCAPRRIRR